MTTTVNGRYPDAEVIVSFSDGWSYSKTRVERFVREGGFQNTIPPKVVNKEVAALKKEDVAYIVSEMEVSKAVAEKALVEAGGDLRKALRKLVGIPPPVIDHEAPQ